MGRWSAIALRSSGLALVAWMLGAGCTCGDAAGPGHTAPTEAPEAAAAPSVDPVAAEAGPLGRFERWSCRVVGLDHDDTMDRVAVIGPRLLDCVARAARAEPSMDALRFSADVFTSPEGVPVNQHLGGDFPSDAAFDAMVGCAGDAIEAIRLAPSHLPEPRASCEWRWAR